MKTNKIPIESPRAPGKEIEFALQHHKPRSVTCCNHIHNAVELLYIHSGEYNVAIDGTSFELKEGDLVFFPSNALHYAFARSYHESSYYVIKVPPTAFLNFTALESSTKYLLLFSMNRIGCKSVWRKSDLEKTDMYAILQAMIREYESRRFAWDLTVKIKAMELLLAILRENEQIPNLRGSASDLVYQAIVYVRTHYAEDISEEQLSREMGISYSHFSRIFKSVTGMTFKKYLNQTRINHAQKLLAKGKHTVSQAATDCGFNSISYFISTYRSIVGITPHKHLKLIESNTEEP